MARTRAKKKGTTRATLKMRPKRPEGESKDGMEDRMEDGNVVSPGNKAKLSLPQGSKNDSSEVDSRNESTDCLSQPIDIGNPSLKCGVNCQKEDNRTPASPTIILPEFGHNNKDNRGFFYTKHTREKCFMDMEDYSNSNVYPEKESRKTSSWGSNTAPTWGSSKNASEWGSGSVSSLGSGSATTWGSSSKWGSTFCLYKEPPKWECIESTEDFEKFTIDEKRNLLLPQMKGCKVYQCNMPPYGAYYDRLKTYLEGVLRLLNKSSNILVDYNF